MPFSERWRFVILAIFTIIVLELIVASVILLNGGQLESGEFIDLLSKPWVIISLAWGEKSFVDKQFYILLSSLVIAVGLKWKLSGDTNYHDAARYGAYGTARFARPREVFNDRMFVKHTFRATPEKNLQNPAGLIFGLMKKKPVILPEDTKIPNRNVFVVGSPGSGKTQSYILTNIIHEQHRSIVVTDPKGEIVRP